MIDFKNPEKSQRIKYAVITVVAMAVIIFVSVYFNNRGEIKYKSQNNSTVAGNTENNLTLTVSPEITPSPVPVITPNLKPLSCNEIYIGNKSRKEVVFTFDAGSGAGSVNKILEILKENNIKSSFFLTGKWAEQNPDIVKKISGDGHEIYNHTYSHPDLTKSTPEEIKSEFERTENIIKNLTGKTTKPFFRPPYGAKNKDVLNSICNENGYQAIMWTVDALDWKEGTSAETAFSRIFSKEQNGEIILMHVGDNLSAEILPDVIKKFADDGYKIVKLSDAIKE